MYFNPSRTSSKINKNWPPALWALAVMVCLSSAAFPQNQSVGGLKPFELSQLSVAPGTKVSGKLAVNVGMDDVNTFIPVTVIHGRHPGPVLSLIAGIHGSEYAPILAMQRLPDLLDPGEMAGTLIIVHIANVPAFQGRTVYFGPNDLKNLNRSFPGDPAGTVTERIANIITQEVMLRSDYFIDIHSGDANESLRPSYSAYYKDAGGESVIAESKRIAIAFGLGTVVQFSGSYANVEDAIYTSAQAVTRGVPAIDIESGELGVVADVFIDPIIKGTLNVMKELEMVTGPSGPPNNPLLIAERARIYSKHQGIWHADALINTGDYVTQGTKLGLITDYFGNHLQTIYAPASGVLLILFGTPPVNEGDNIVVIGQLPEDAD